MSAVVAPLSSRAPAARPRLALAGLGLATLLASLGLSIANVGLPALAAAFAAPFAAVQWVVLAYLLAATALVVGAGRLGDLFGRRRLLLIGLGLFALASVAGAAAPSLSVLIAARVAQGAGAALTTALAMALVGDAVPRARVGAAMGGLGTLSAVGTALGPTCGGLLIAGYGWRALFVLLVPPAVLAGGLVWRGLPADAARSAAPRFDALGTALLAAALVAYAFAMTSGRGRFGVLEAGLLGAAALLALAWWRVQARVPEPLVAPALLRDAALRGGLAGNTAAAAMAMATLVVGPFYLSGVLGLGPAAVGAVMSAGPLAAALLGVPSGRSVDRFGAARTMQLGLAAMTAGAGGLAALVPGWGVPGYVLPLVTLTAGFALFQAANNAALVGGSAAAQRGLVAGLLSLSRYLGLITGAAALGAVFALVSGGGHAGDPAAVLAGARAAFAAATVLGAAALGATRWRVRRRATLPA